MTTNTDSKNDIPKVEEDTSIKVYKQRFIVVFLFCLYAVSNAFQNIQYAVVADVVKEYYNISNLDISWTITIYSVTYIVLFIPVSYCINKWSIRTSVLLGATANCLGAWIKMLSVSPDRFWVLLIGQGVSSLARLFILPFPPKIAAVWFGADEVSIACSASIIGTSVGSSFGSLIPTLLVTKDNVQGGLMTNTLLIAVYCSILLPLIYFFFAKAPPTPPSIAQLKVTTTNKTPEYMKVVKNLLSNRSYIIYVLLYSVNIAAFSALLTLLNQTTVYYYKDAQQDVGTISLVVAISSIFASLFGAYLIDKFKQFRLTTYLVHAAVVATMALYIFTLDIGLYMMYIALPLVGVTVEMLTIVGLTVVIEITYPEPEAVTGGMINMTMQLATVIIIEMYTLMFDELGIFYTNLIILVITAALNVLFVFMKFDLKRQNAQANN